MPIYTLRSGADNHTEDSVLQLLTDLVVMGGVLDVVGGDVLVSEKGLGADMSVDIAAGRFYLKKSGNVYPVRSTDVENVVIANNTSGNPVVASIVAYLNLGADPSVNDDGSGVVIFTKVLGTPAASPVAPTASEIATAVGASNPYEVFANITVPNNTADIENGDINDVRRRVYMKTPSPIHTVDYAATIAPSINNGVQQEISLVGNITLNEPSNMNVGDVLFLEFYQDATGSRVLTFGFTVRASGGENPDLDGTPSTSTVIAIRKVGISTYHAQHVDLAVE